MSVGAPASAATPTSTSATTPTPGGKPLDGSPVFEAAKPVNLDSPSASVPPPGPLSGAPAGGMNLSGFPAWLSQYFGGSSGGAAPAPATPAAGQSSLTPFQPGGTTLSGYGMYRPPTTFTPPPKVATAPVQSNTPLMPSRPLYDMWQQEMLRTGKTPTIEGISPEQSRMLEWDYASKARQSGSDYTNNANGVPTWPL